MSALMLLRGLSFSTRKICSSLSKEMKFPNQERFASLSRRGWLEAGQEGAEDMKNLPPSSSLPRLTHSGEDSGVKLDISSAVGTGEGRAWSILVHHPRAQRNQGVWTQCSFPPPRSQTPNGKQPKVPSRNEARPIRPRPCGWGLLVMSQWEGDPERPVGVSFRGGGSTSSTLRLHLCSQPHLTPGCGNPGPSPLLRGPRR